MKHPVYKIHRNGIAFFQPIVEDKTAAYWSYGIVLKPHRGVRHLATKFKKKEKEIKGNINQVDNNKC